MAQAGLTPLHLRRRSGPSPANAGNYRDQSRKRLLPNADNRFLKEYDDGGYTSICPELDIASLGDTEDEADANLREAIDLLLETAPRAELERRYRPGVRIRSMEVEYA